MSIINIIVPIYNAGRMLHHCIQSIQDQSFRDWNLLLIDDGSTDYSLQLCHQYAKDDNRIQVHTQPQSGSIVARRKGLELSDSTYIMFVDADDWIDGEMLERMLQAAERANTDVTVCNTYKVISDAAWPKKANASHFFHNERQYNGDEIRNDLIPSFLHGHLFPAQLHGKLYKRNLLLTCGTYLSRINFFGDDLYFNLEVFLKAQSILTIPDRLYYYRVGGSTSRYMPYLFQDIVNGYSIQKEVIDHYYPNERSYHSFGIRVMLLNSLQTCIQNLFLHPFTEQERHATIGSYCKHEVVKECANDDTATDQFSKAYIHAIKMLNTNYLHKLGLRSYQFSIPKKIILNAISKFPIQRIRQIE